MPFVSTDLTTFNSIANAYRFTVQENSPAGTVIGKFGLMAVVTEPSITRLSALTPPRSALKLMGR